MSLRPSPCLVPVLAACVWAMVGCGADDPRVFEFDAGDGRPPVGNCVGLGSARGPTQACCPTFGVDACGAGLFCDAFDGRSTYVCYAERSRLSGSECREDVHCGSGACALPAGRCMALPGEACTTDVGCAVTGGLSFRVPCRRTHLLARRGRFRRTVCCGSGLRQCELPDRNGSMCARCRGELRKPRRQQRPARLRPVRGRGPLSSWRCL